MVVLLAVVSNDEIEAITLGTELIAGVAIGIVILALFLARPVALAFALLKAGLSRQEWIAAAWFGPKGFASVVYGLLILEAGLVRSDELFHLIAAVIALSIAAHASTDVPVARWFRHAQPDEISAPTEIRPPLDG